MTDYETLVIENIDPVAIVTLNRPEVHNAFNSVMIKELTSAFAELSLDSNVRIIVLTGEGRSFSAGADLNYMRACKDFNYEKNREDAVELEKLFNRIYITPKPVIVKVNGAAFGGGVGLIAACDIAISLDRAKFAFSEVNLGIIPAVISPYVVPKIGSKAKRYFLTGERFDANTAMQIGLIHEVASDHNELDQKVADIINHLLTSNPTAMTQIKILLEKNRNTEFEELRSYCIESIAKLRTSPDGKEGLSAFLEKRPPNWALGTWKGQKN